MGEHNCYGSDVHTCIQHTAYELWEKEGHKQGHDLEYWLRAEDAVHGHGSKKAHTKY